MNKKSVACSSMEERRSAGDVIFKEGDTADRAYIIEAGRVRVSVERDGKPFTLGELGTGEIIGEMAMIDEYTRTATATVIEDCRLTVVTPQQIRQRIESSDPVVRSLLRILLTRYRSELELRRESPAPAGNSLLSYYAGIRKIRFENELIQALETGAIGVVYQPIFRLDPAVLIGFEALVRWEHPELGAIPSSYLVGLAEETDLINTLEDHVFGVAIDDLSAIKAAAPDGLFMSINISPRHTSDQGFLHRIVDHCSRAGQQACDIVLELTESVLVDVQRLGEWAAASREMGFRLTVDDFGTGFASLEYLTRLAPDIVKLDQSFVGSIIDNPRSISVLRRILEMAKDLDVEVIAEGVETAEHAHTLASLGCDMVQGFYVGHPLPPAEAALLAAGKDGGA